MPAYRSSSTKKTTLFVLFGLLCIASLSFLLIGSEEDVVRDVGLVEEAEEPPMAKKRLEEEWVIAPEVYKERSVLINQRTKTIRSEAHLHQPRCDQFTQQQQLLDINCTALWLNRLKNDRITGVERLWGFEDTHYGAITLNLENGMRAMFKPCSSASEDTSKELIASYLDQLLGFGQTAPVATRIIPVSAIDQYCTDSEMKRVLQETVDLCAEDEYFVGPMIGWWDSLVPIRTVRKYKEEVEILYEQRAELAENLLTTQMQSKYHAFYMLIHILRHGKDEFITMDGDLVSLDLDRSRFRTTNPLIGPAVNYTWCFTCYMDEWVYDTFQAVGPSQPIDNRLGPLMKTMLSEEEIFPDLWDSRLATALDVRVEMLLDCVDACIQKWGYHNVILNEPRSMSAKELVEYFVTHSQYKTRNGQQGPSNLDFLDEM